MSLGAGVAATLVLSALPAAAPAAPAAAVPAKAGETYVGQVEDAPATQDAVTFHVSKNGTWVRKLRVGPWPLSGSCGSGGDAPPEQSAEPARIKHGKFTAHVVYRTDGEVVSRATVTGTFLRKGKEKGVVSSHRISDSSDVSLPYRTHTQ
jgi:hypothetical protein